MRPFPDPLRHGTRLSATTTSEVVQEFAHLYARRRNRAEAAAHARDYVRLLGPLLATDDQALHGGLDVFELSPRLRAFDSVLAATARRAGARALVSADTTFGTVEGLPWVAPGSPEWAELARTGD